VKINVKKAIVIVGIQLLFAELVCFIALQFYLFPQHRRFFHEDYEQHFNNIPAKLITQFAGHDQLLAADVKFDSDLGWDNVPKINGMHHGCKGKPWFFSFDEDTGRKTPTKTSNEDAQISLYGGSFTLGAEVNDNQTWQYYLEQLSGENVKNYGVGGYGTDQALFKLERNLKRGLKTPVIVIGIYSAAMPRLMTTYRPFYAPYGGLEMGFKPMLQKTAEGNYDWLPSALTDITEDEDIRIAFDKAAEDDYYYAQNKEKPHMGFPYILTTLRVTKYMFFDYEKERNLWVAGHEASDKMDEIIKRFVALSKSEEFSPVVVFMPQDPELDGYEKGEPPFYATYLERLRERYSENDLLLIDILDEKLNPKEFALRGCHPSDYGHQIIATAVHRELQTKNLISESDRK